MILQVETWKDIPNYEGIYQVSTYGRVRSLDRIDSLGRVKKGKVLKPQFDGRKNYLHVTLRNKCVQVHTLVATAFIPNPNGYCEVNHKDEDKTNNFYNNLEWCTHKYNNNYGSKQFASKGTNNAMNKFSEQEIINIRRDRANGMKLKDISAKYGISQSHASHVCTGSRWEWLDDITSG